MRNLLLSLLSREWAGLPLALIVGLLFAIAALATEGLFRSALFLLGAFALILLTVASVRHLLVLSATRRAYPPPGRMVNLGGYRVHVLAEGQAREGRPAIVWFAGGHTGGLAMHHLHRATKTETRSILIDRPGTGWSDVGPFPRSTAKEAQEVILALEHAGEPGPFIWVGHSFGGLLAANVARRRPDLVHTLVLLDPTPLETIVFGPRLSAIKDMRRTAWMSGLAHLFGVNLQRRAEQQLNKSPAHQRVTRSIEQVLGPEVIAARCLEARAGTCFSNASIFDELTPEGVAACAWDTVVYDGDLGDLPVWLVAPKESLDADIAALPEAQYAQASCAHRMMRFFAATRERYLATSTKACRIVAPSGSGHNFIYEEPEFTVAVIRELLEKTGQVRSTHSRIARGGLES